ncbi:TraR/DksA C4-type zinc finger protein [Halopseudomonas sp. SMJS2]|uniref:TraR/DksA C4-type zinc finger protein n=1 Tax=Halopseudomonas sp. SMJS2 TaxID=3041098 RepID=UPI002452841E|nr:TraR/DksA C4-type zinc finger protein [Halopseudomonas sp. SMJS2]WGK60532.1 TraR/DksA C4-type zinc finger protein [Halopseudomonas sp. SMJS2]
MADEIEIAGDYIQRKTDERTAAIRAQLQGEGQDWCEDCGEDIPQARRLALPSATRCTPCQGLVDAKRRAYG